MNVGFWPKQFRIAHLHHQTIDINDPDVVMLHDFDKAIVCKGMEGSAQGFWANSQQI